MISHYQTLPEVVVARRANKHILNLQVLNTAAKVHVVRSWTAVLEVHMKDQMLSFVCPIQEGCKPRPQASKQFVAYRDTTPVLCKFTALQCVCQLTSSTSGNL